MMFHYFVFHETKEKLFFQKSAASGTVGESAVVYLGGTGAVGASATVGEGAMQALSLSATPSFKK